MQHKLKQSFSIALLLFILGFFVVVQLRSVYKNRDITDVDSKRAEEIQLLLNNERDKNQRLTEEYFNLQKEVETMKSEDKQGDARISVAEERLKELQEIAGLTDVSGPGVVVTMRTPSRSPIMEGSENDNYFDISEADILQVINELRDSGAEAMSLNDQRLLSTSEIKVIDNTVSVNRVKTVSPYVIKAIGDAKSLEAALNVKNGVIGFLKDWGIEVDVVKSNKLKIKAYDGAIVFKHAVSDVKE